MALKTYLDRGILALKKFEQGDLDSFIAVLKQKSAAFHNFKAADSILAKQGINTDEDPQVARLWPMIREADQKLAEAIIEATKATRDELNRNQRVRTSISKYRSRRLRDFVFERTI